MFSWEKGTEIAIWGTGKRARKFYLRYCNYFKVKFFIDNFSRGDNLDSIKINAPKDIVVKKIKIVIAIDNYKEVCDQCKELGMRFFDDYLPFNLVDFTSLDFMQLWELVDEDAIKIVFNKIVRSRPYCILIGNCQMSAVKKILLSSRMFRTEYFLLDIPLIHMITQEQMDIMERCIFIFTECSLCITQNIDKNNSFCSFYATENIRRLFNAQRQLIVIPVLYFDLYFPQTIHQNAANTLLSEVGILSFPYGDCILNELSKKYSVEDIIKIVCLDNLFSAKLLQWIYDTRLKEMQDREELCDVRIYDYIIQHFREEQLFYSKNHPTKKVFIEFGNRLLSKLGFNDGKIEQIRMPVLDGWQEIIYPSVAFYYGFYFDKTMYLDHIIDEECDLEEILRLYLFSICGKA